MAPRTEEQYKEIRGKSRQKIIDAALQLFANTGYHRTSMSAIAKEAGVSKGLIYNYFTSKEELLQGIFEMGLKDADILFSDHKEPDPHERLKGMILDTFELMKEHGTYYKLLMGLVMQPKVTDGIKEFMDQAAAGKLQLAVALFTDLGYDDPMGTALYFDATMEGILIASMIVGHDYPVETMKAKLIEQYCTPNNKQ